MASKHSSIQKAKIKYSNYQPIYEEATLGMTLIFSHPQPAFGRKWYKGKLFICQHLLVFTIKENE